jgi:predicted ArsR family transcriptional regulator
MEQVRDLIQKYGMISTPDLAKLVGLNENTVRDYVDVLHQEHRIYISEWREIRLKGCPTRLWSIGDQPDTPKPGEGKAIVTVKETRAEMLDRISDELDEIARKKKTAQIQPFRDPLVWALFGGVEA